MNGGPAFRKRLGRDGPRVCGHTQQFCAELTVPGAGRDQHAAELLRSWLLRLHCPRYLHKLARQACTGAQGMH
jgi:hypothetical protein